MRKVNLGCGPVFIDSPDWINLDFSPASSAVRKANLLDTLPLADESASLVYSSHFLEHVPRDLVPGLLRDWSRVLQPGGIVRLVVPDLENMAREYLSMRESGAHEKADFVVLEIIDQCVRRESGGELGRLYRQLASQEANSAAPMIEYIRQRTGEDLRSPAAAGGGGATSAVFPLPCAVASSAPGFASACSPCQPPFVRRTSAWRRWGNATIGCGTSISSRQRSRLPVLSMCKDAAPTAVPSQTFHSIHWTSIPRDSHARGWSHFTWRRASPARAPRGCAFFWGAQ